MHEQPANPVPRPARRQLLPPWGLFVALLATRLGLAAHYGSLARQDAVVAPREQNTVGRIVKIVHGKHPTAWYSFTYAERQYRGKDGISSSHCLCDVTVYFDPEHPSTNSLVEYKRRTWADHSTMVICLWMSATFAAILVFILAMRRKKPTLDYSSAS